MLHCVVWRSIARPRKASGMLRKTTIESQCQMKKDMDFFSALCIGMGAFYLDGYQPYARRYLLN